MVIFFRIFELIYFRFVVAKSDIVHGVEVTVHLP